MTRLKEENDPNGDYTLEFESAIRAVDKEAGMTRVKALFDMGAKIPSKHAYMLADVPEVEDGDTNYLQSVQYQQQEQQQLIDEHAPPMGTEDTSYLKGANHQEDVSGIFRAGSKPTGVTLAEARRKPEAKGVASEDVPATACQGSQQRQTSKSTTTMAGCPTARQRQCRQLFNRGRSLPPSGRKRMHPGQQAAGGGATSRRGKSPTSKPSAGRHVQVGGDEHAAASLNRCPGRRRRRCARQAGVATHGVHARILMLAKEGGASLKGEGVPSEVMNVDC